MFNPTDKVVPQSFQARRVTVMGLGRFGGGVGVARYLVQHGATVCVTDMADAEQLTDSLAQLADITLADPAEQDPDAQRPGVWFRLGEHVDTDFTDTDLVVVNPAVKPGNRYVEAARRAGVSITSEIRLLVAALPNPQRVIGITGSAGKSTTTAMIGHVLNATGHTAHVGGNLGGSLLGVVDTITPDDWIVLELSSFMLQGLDDDAWSPHIAAVTNLTPNHLDWHGSFDAYAHAKQTILEHQRLDDNDLCVLGENVAPPLRPMVPQVLSITMPTLELAIPGEHNRINAQMAVKVCAAAGVEPERSAEALKSFRGLPHRLAYVGERDGVRCYNDSKCTTPEAALLALKAFEPGSVHLIVGGYDKGSDFHDLAAFAASHAKGVYGIGTVGPQIVDLVRNASLPDPGTQRPDTCGAVTWGTGADTVHCHTLDNAVAEALSRAHPGDVLLLSPACASWDQFTNYEARGNIFVQAVQASCPES